MACKTCARIRQLMDIADLVGDVAQVTTPASAAALVAEQAAPVVARKISRSRVAKKASANLSKALSKVNAQARKKSGELKKGWTQSKIMKKAHSLAKKMK